MSEPAWSLPMNRTELIARCAAFEAALRRTKAALNHYPGAWKSLNELIDGLLSSGPQTTGESDADTDPPNR